MKKNLAIVTTMVSAGIALVFIVLLVCASFGALNAEDFDNTVARTLLIAFSGIFTALSAATAGFLLKKGFRDEVQVASAPGGIIKVKQKVVKKLVKKSVSAAEGVKFRGCVLFIDENGVRLELSVNFYGGVNAAEASENVRKLASEACRNKLGLRLSAVDIRVVGLGGRKNSKATANGTAISSIKQIADNDERNAEYPDIDEEPFDTAETDALKNILKQLGADNAEKTPADETATVAEDRIRENI